MTRHIFGMRWEGKRHQIGEPSLQERRVARLLRIASRTYAGWERFNERHIELTGVQDEPNKQGIR